MSIPSERKRAILATAIFALAITALSYALGCGPGLCTTNAPLKFAVVLILLGAPPIAALVKFGAFSRGFLWLYAGFVGIGTFPIGTAVAYFVVVALRGTANGAQAGK